MVVVWWWYLRIYSDTLAKSTELSTLSDNARKLAMKRSQKSRKSGRSIFFRPSLVLASTLTYSCVTGTRSLYKQTYVLDNHSITLSLSLNSVFWSDQFSRVTLGCSRSPKNKPLRLTKRIFVGWTTLLPESQAQKAIL